MKHKKTTYTPSHKRYYERYRDKCRQYCREYYLKHREESLAKSKKWRETHQEQYKNLLRKYQANFRETIEYLKSKLDGLE